MVDKFDTRDGGTLVVTYDESRNSVYYPSDTKLEEIIYVKKNGESEVIYGGEEDA
jgi:hypothetical protein